MKMTFAVVSILFMLSFTACKTSKTDRKGDAAQHQAHQSSADLLEKYWKVIEINGTPVPAPAQNKREAHMILRANNQVNGNGGCNSFSGSYALSGATITFAPVVATKMACLNDNREDEFFASLIKTNSYAVKNDTLTLFNDQTAPIAQLVAVYLR